MKCLESEAKQWFARLTVIPNRTQVILGLGAGLHALEFAKHIDGPVFVIDPRRPLVDAFSKCHELISTSRSEIRKINVGSYEEILPHLDGQRFQVQQYRPCWGSHAEEFIGILDSLNQRRPGTSSARYCIDQMSSNELVSLKTIKSTDDKILLLQELIQ